jgi:hypothetical protein
VKVKVIVALTLTLILTLTHNPIGDALAEGLGDRSRKSSEATVTSKDFHFRPGEEYMIKNPAQWLDYFYPKSETRS